VAYFLGHPVDAVSPTPAAVADDGTLGPEVVEMQLQTVDAVTPPPVLLS